MSEIARKAALDKIGENIDRHGYHIYVVAGRGIPHYAYTIGISKTHGAELILAGSYFYLLDDVSQIVSSIVEALPSPLATDGTRFDLARFGTFSLNSVDMTWVTKLMSGALDFYQVKDVRSLQIVPDAAHWTIDIPNLSKPLMLGTAPGWQRLYEHWNLPIPQDSVCLTNLDALRGERITEVMRWENDEWEMFAGAGPDIPKEERRVVPIGILLANDESLAPAVNLSVGTGLWRDDVSEWHPWRQSGKNDTLRE